MQTGSSINNLLNMLLKDLINATALKQLLFSKIPQVRNLLLWHTGFSPVFPQWRSWLENSLLRSLKWDSEGKSLILFFDVGS